MRDPTVNARAAAEAKRVRDAIDAAKRDLWFMVCRLHIDDEKYPVEAAYWSAVDLTARIFSLPGADNLIRECASDPNARDKILSAFRQVEPARRPGAGRRELKLRDLWLADIIENTRRRLDGFDVHRGFRKPNRVRESICSIVATAWRELADEVRENQKQMRTTLLEQGFTSLQANLRIQDYLATLFPRKGKPLAEGSFERIYDESKWGARYRLMKARRDTD